MHRLGLRFDAQVVVAGIVPAPTVEAGNVFARLEFAECRRTLGVAVEEDQIGRRHARVVEMTRAVPDPVALVDAHVAHLDWQEVFKRRLPDAVAVHVGADLEGGRLGVAVAHEVHAGARDGREIEPQVLVAQEPAPFGGRGFEDGFEAAVFGDARDYDRVALRVARIQLDHGPFLLGGMVADLGNLDNRRGLPARDRVGRDEPVDRTLRGAGGDERADDKPAVVVLAAAIDQFEPAAVGVFDQQALALRFGGDDEAFARRHRGGVIFTGAIERTRAAGLEREDARLRFRREGFPEEDAGKKFEIEADLADPFGRQRRVEIDDDAKRRALGAHAERVAEFEVGVIDGVKTDAVLRVVGKLGVHADLARGAIDDALAHLRRGGPLARRAVEAEVAVGRDAQAVLQDAYAALVAFRVVVVREHDVEAWHLQIL